MSFLLLNFGIYIFIAATSKNLENQNFLKDAKAKVNAFVFLIEACSVFFNEIASDKKRTSFYTKLY